MSACSREKASLGSSRDALDCLSTRACSDVFDRAVKQYGVSEAENARHDLHQALSFFIPRLERWIQ